MKKSVKILSLFLFSIIIISILASFVSAADTTTPLQDFTDFFKGFLTGGFGVDTPLFAKLLFIILLTLIIFAISDAIPFLENAGGFVKTLIAIIVAVLATLYLTPEDVTGILISYTTLGIVMTSFIPFVILLVFSIQWKEKGYNIIFMKFLWVAFGVVLFIMFFFIL